MKEAKKAWASGYSGLSQTEVDDRVRGFSALVRLIAEEGAVTPTRFAEYLGLDVSRAERVLVELEAVGMQTDDAGHIVGAALTTSETPHKVSFADKNLYAWCALDTLFIPGLVGQTADIESICPATNKPVQLRIAPDRIELHEPDDIWLSVFLPKLSSRELGPTSPT